MTVRKPQGLRENIGAAMLLGVLFASLYAANAVWGEGVGVALLFAAALGWRLLGK